MQSRNLCRFGTNRRLSSEKLGSLFRKSSCRCISLRRRSWCSRCSKFLELYAETDLDPKLLLKLWVPQIIFPHVTLKFLHIFPTLKCIWLSSVSASTFGECYWLLSGWQSRAWHFWLLSVTLCDNQWRENDRNTLSTPPQTYKAVSNTVQGLLARFAIFDFSFNMSKEPLPPWCISNDQVPTNLKFWLLSTLVSVTLANG